VLKRAGSNEETERGSCLVCTLVSFNVIGASDQMKGMWNVLEGMHTVFW